MKSVFVFIALLLFTACVSSTNKESIKKKDIKCSSKPDSGRCKAYIKKYYFNENTNTCEMFVWGGCGGNIPFKNLKECKIKCEI